MNRSSHLPRRTALIALAAAWIGCSNTPTPPELAAPAPIADSPLAALRVLEWCWNQRDTTLYASLLPADFVFAFGALDPYGTAYRDHPWTRTDERISTRNLFYGSTDKVAASRISLTLDRNFRVVADPRPGKNSRWHRLIRTGLFLTVVDGDYVRTDASGSGDFYFVRGDSAVLPLIDGGVVPDSTRWHLERWEDGSAISSGAGTQPAKTSSVGSIKALYR